VASLSFNAMIMQLWPQAEKIFIKATKPSALRLGQI